MYIIIETTTDDEIVAKRIAKNILEDHLASCIQTINNITSTYTWNDKNVYSKEFLIRIKTDSNLSEKVFKLIKKLHNYDIPELISYTFDINSNKYNKWFDQSLDK